MTSCPICQKKYKKINDFLSHLESDHKNGDCGCNSQGGGGMIYKGASEDEMDKFEKVLREARKKVEKAEKDMQMNEITYGLKLGKKDIVKIPEAVREKVRSMSMENEYLRGIIRSQEQQIRMMKKHIDKCIDGISFRYVMRKKM